MAIPREDSRYPSDDVISETAPLNAATDETATEEAEVKRTFRENVIYFFKNITLEPTVVLYIMAYMITSFTTTNLGLMKACRVNLNFTEEICTAMREQQLESQNPYEREAQRLLTSAVAQKTYITASVASILGLLVGPWSDKTGHRKIFLILSICGLTLSCINSLLHVYFFYEINLQALIFSEAAIESLSGGMCVVAIIVFSYIAAITSNETRTFRMGMVNICITMGMPIGLASSGFIVRNLGYYGGYGISLGLHIVNLMYNIFVLKDPPRTSEHKLVRY